MGIGTAIVDHRLCRPHAARAPPTSSSQSGARSRCATRSSQQGVEPGASSSCRPSRVTGSGGRRRGASRRLDRRQVARRPPCSRASSSSGRFSRRSSRSSSALAGLVAMCALPVAAVPDDHAGAGHGVGDLSGRRFEDAGRLRRLADRAADQRRRQHALHVVDELGHRPADADRLLLARHRPRHRAGAGAEPRQPRDAAAAVSGDAAGRVGAEEIVVDHDADRRVRKRRPLQPRTTSPITPTCTCWTR